MKRIALATKRHWNWKVLLILVGLIIPAAFAILPYTLNLQNAYSKAGTVAPLGWDILLLDRLINILLIVLPGGIGLALANRIGLGMPFAEGWIKREPLPCRFRSLAAVAWITAVAVVLVGLLLHNLVFDPPLTSMLEKLGITIPEGAHTAPLYGFLAALSAGITEEMLFRLFGLSLLAWLGSLFFHDSDGRPHLIVLWTADILFALAFGAAHLPKAAAMGWPINAFVITYTLVLNGIGGLAFGWLFWTYGLESAMLAHFFADVIMYTLIPIIDMQNGETARHLAIAAILVAILAALVLAFRSLIVERHKQSHSHQITIEAQPQEKI